LILDAKWGRINMGLFDFVRSQFIEVIEWTDDTLDTMVYRFPVQNKEIKMGAKLTVRESQAAIFVNEGTIADVFSAGLYELSTQNMPVITKLKSWKYGFNSPFKAEVYFVNTKQFSDQKWGTTNPIMMRDAEFGMLRLRAFGIYSFRVSDPAKFMKEVCATSQIYDTESITGQLKRSIISGITDLLGEANVPALDLVRYYDEFGEQAKVRLQPRFEAFGLQLISIYFENISLPEEVEKVLDKKTSMGVLGNMQQYAQYQAADSIKDAAQNPGNMFAGAGVGLGAGAVLGNMMADVFKNNNQPTVNNTVNQTVPGVICPNCKSNVAGGQKFCGSCGQTLVPPKAKCVKCNEEINTGLKFCPECGAKQSIEIICSGCGKKLDTGLKFCPECGAKI
jgi:membrane protease subunit (stomatin/prohibitin family)